MQIPMPLWKKTPTSTPLWVFFTFLKLYRWYQIEQNITINQMKKSLGVDSILREEKGQ